MAHQELGRELLERVATDIDGFGKNGRPPNDYDDWAKLVKINSANSLSDPRLHSGHWTRANFFKKTA